MAISLQDEKKNELSNSGAIIDTTQSGGDTSGTFGNLTVDKIKGKTVPSTGSSEGQALRIGNDGNFIYSHVLDENSNFGGNVSGNQAVGLRVVAIDNVTAELTGITEGQTLKLNSSGVLVPSNDNSGYDILQVATNTQASTKQEIFINTTSSTVTITTKNSPVEKDTFIVYDSHGTAGTNSITINVPSGDSIEGVIDESVQIDVNNAVIKFYFNGTTWKYYVISVRP